MAELDNLVTSSIFPKEVLELTLLVTSFAILVEASKSFSSASLMHNKFFNESISFCFALINASVSVPTTFVMILKFSVNIHESILKLNLNSTLSLFGFETDFLIKLLCC